MINDNLENPKHIKKSIHRSFMGSFALVGGDSVGREWSKLCPNNIFIILRRASLRRVCLHIFKCTKVLKRDT